MRKPVFRKTRIFLNAADLPLDRIVRKEVALGTVREIPPPGNHIGDTLAPFLEVESDDVIFDYATGMTEGLAPAAAEDAESELAQKDDLYLGQGRASLIDWRIKDVYTSSDVTRYREALFLEQQQGGLTSLPLNFVGRTREDFDKRVARDTARRRRMLDNRRELMIMSAIGQNVITYNDGKIKFTVPFGRPVDQSNQVPLGGTWNLTTSDPIGAINAMNDVMQERYGIRLKRAIGSTKALNSVQNSDKFVARSGLVAAPVPVGAAPGSPIDLDYLMEGWGADAARQVVSRATGVRFDDPYDSVWRSRAIGATNFVNNRFLDEKIIVFLPDPADLAEFDDTQIGFGKTLTSPHPMGNFTSGFYEWEKDRTDPWNYEIGTGIKMFPVFPHMELTFTMQVLP